MGGIVTVFLAIVALLSGLQGVIMMLAGTTVMHQVVCALYWLIFVVAVCTGILVGAIDQMVKRLPQPRPRPAVPPPSGQRAAAPPG